MNKTRLEAFSDGVLAIIITIMVLELKVPQGTSWEAIQVLLPTLGSYLLSFVFIGIYWANHHHLIHLVHSVNGKIIWANMHLLFWLSLVPFATHWMGESHFNSISVAIYGGLLVCCGIAFTILSKTIASSNPTPIVNTSAFVKNKKKEMVSTILYLSSIPLAFVHPLISCLLFAAVSILWIVPSKEIEKLVSEV